MAAPVITLTNNTTSNTALTPAAALNGAAGWAAGDVVIVAVIGSDLTGCTAIFAASGGAQLEGLAVNTGVTLGDADRDISVPSWAQSLFSSVWSARIEVLGTGLTVATAYGAGANPKRSFVYRLRPDTGKVIPVRASRIATTGTTNGTATGAGLRSITLGAVPSTTRDIAAFAAVMGASTLTAGIAFDLDGDGTDDTGGSFAQSSQCAVGALGLAAGSAHWPATASKIDIKTNPSSGWSIAEVIYYAQVGATTLSGKGSLVFGAKGTIGHDPTLHPGKASIVFGAKGLIKGASIRLSGRGSLVFGAFGRIRGRATPLSGKSALVFDAGGTLGKNPSLHPGKGSLVLGAKVTAGMGLSPSLRPAKAGMVLGAKGHLSGVSHFTARGSLILGAKGEMNVYPGAPEVANVDASLTIIAEVN